MGDQLLWGGQNRRLEPVDALRGLIMVLMALDHANYFVARQHPPSEFWNAPIPPYADGLAFLTRFVTHLSAPGFFFLMGVGITLLAASRRRSGWTHASIFRHLVVRGVILIALQLLVENRAWPLVLPPQGGDIFLLYMGVLYGLGGAMVLGALLLPLGTKTLIVLSLGAVAVTQALLAAPNLEDGGRVLRRLLFVPSEMGSVLVYYPVVAWFGLVGFGMIFGRWLMHNQGQAYRRALVLGAASILLFVLSRAIVDPDGASGSANADWISFLYVVKYPPSVAFILLTLGVNLLMLWTFARLAWGRDGLGRWAHPLLVFGRSALLFYVLHLFLYAVIGLMFAPNGTGIPVMYLVWLAGLAILYPVCWWYARVKHEKAMNSPLRWL